MFPHPRPRRMRHRPTALLLVGLGFAAPAWADGLSVQVLEFGQMQGEPASGQRDPTLRDQTLSGVQPINRPRFVQHGAAVQVRYCDGFGIMFQPRGVLPGHAAVIQVRNDHPLLTRPDGVSSSSDLYDIRVDGGQSWVGFTFSESWSLVPGRWTITLEHDGQVLARQDFDVTKAPDPGTLEANGCSIPVS